MSAAAHQRMIRDRLAAEEPRDAVASLAGYSVETIHRNDAVPLIARYEWLGTMGNTTRHVGLWSPDRELHGVACFGYGPGFSIRNIIGAPALCLERGACVHYAPRNAASYLITHACKLIYRTTGTAIFFAYGDPNAGEYGAVYQAAGWAYIGQGLNGKRADRKRRYVVLAPGRDPDVVQNWQTAQELKRHGYRLQGAWDRARADGWQIAYRAARHVYATNVGRDRMRWREALICSPYPAPRPELKLRRDAAKTGGPAKVKCDRVVCLTSPPKPPQFEFFEEIPSK